MKTRVVRTILVGLILQSVTGLSWGYNLITNPTGGAPVKWPAGSISMKIMADNATPLSDGYTRAGSIQSAMQAWNVQIKTVQFQWEIVAVGEGTNHNHVNEIFFSSTAYGEAFDSNTLAVTTDWYSVSTSQRTEGDIIFNTAFTWDSYFGSLRAAEEIRRVALHELGHVLGLDHPDQASPPQYVSAIMNSTVGYIDSLQYDDIAGAQSLYGTPDSAPIFYTTPYPTTVYAGQSTSFYAYASGSPIPMYQWQRLPLSGTWVNLTDNSTYSGTANGTLVVNVAASAMNGDQYRCVATNAAGTATSSAATLTVNPAVPPVFSVSLPASLTLSYGDTINLSAYLTSGTSPISYQWSKDSVAIPGATSYSYYKTFAKTADSGQYTLTASNYAGSATVSVAITVTSAVAPTISGLSSSLSLSYGSSLYLYPSVSGSQPITYQWKKNAVAIPGATSSSYSSSYVTVADSGQYTLTATNDAGSTTSTSVTVTVNAALAPAISGLPTSMPLSYGGYLSLYPVVAGTAPITYEWKKDGVAIPNATTSYYQKSYMTQADAGEYTLVATNLVGAVTSSAITVTVSAAVAPSVTISSSNLTVIYGDSFSFYNVNVTGTSPITYQWAKDGVPIAGATSYYFSKSYATGADSGQYTLTATNFVGSTTSAVITVTVATASPPSISPLAATLTVPYGGQLNISPNVQGTQPMTYTWKKDGVTISSSAYNASYSRSYSTTSDSGQYMLTVTNFVGSATSTTVAVTVSPAIAPTFTQQPISVGVARGNSASFAVVATGTNPISYQWYRNGVLIPNATSSSYYFASVSASDAGSYSVAATNVAASVGSNAATLTVLPAAPPQAIWPTFGLLNVNSVSSLNLSGPQTITGSPPFSYQWFKDGVPIPGATLAYFWKSNPAPTDVGVYTLQISNDAGIIMSPEYEVIWLANSNDRPWLDAYQLGDIVYFLAASPGRVLRYDLSQESWLSSVNLTAGKTPTAFLPTSQGVFIAYGTSLVRRSLDLQTETPISTSNAVINCLFSFGNLLYYQANPSVVSYKLSDLGAGPTFSPPLYAAGLSRQARPVFSVALKTGFTTRPGTSPDDIIQFTVGNDGAFTTSSDSPYHGNFAVGFKQYLTPDGVRLIDSTGVVYRADDLNYAGSLGLPFDDLAYASDGTPLVLRGNRLSEQNSANFTETGRFVLATQGYNVFSRSGAAYVFGAPASTGENPQVAKVLASDFVPAAPPVSLDPINTRFSIEDAFVDNHAVVHLVSRSQHGLVRWDATTCGFLPSIPLRGSPSFVSYAPAADRLVLAYTDGTLTDFLPSLDEVDHPFGLNNISNGIFAMIAMDDLVVLNIRDAGTTGDARVVVNDTGAVKYWSNAGLYSAPGLAWQSVTRRLYSGATLSSGSVQYEVVPTSGILPGQSFNGTAGNITAPLRFNAVGTSLLTMNGLIMSGDLIQTATIANVVADGVWLPDGLYTIRASETGTQLQKWSLSGFSQTGALSLSGYPLRVLRLDDSRVVVVTLINGYVGFDIVSTSLSLLSAADNGVPAPAVIVTAPKSLSLAPGNPASFSVTVMGKPPFTYQWRRNGIAIGGATESTFTLASVSLADAGDYTVVITNAAGSTISPAGTLLVDHVPIITSQPVNNHYITVGAGVTFTISADARPAATYQWKKNGADISGATGSSYTIGSALLSDAAAYTVVVSNNLGSVISNAGVLSVKVPPINPIARDFSMDGHPDILWRNTVSGDVAVWFMNGTSFQQGEVITTVDLVWEIAGTGDFNGDGSTDILWRNTISGDVALWVMSGTSFQRGYVFDSVPLVWQIMGTGDFDGDGKTDIVWRNMYDGSVALWVMNGTTFQQGFIFDKVDLVWELTGTGDFNGDGKTDLLWRNTYDGSLALWVMNGTSFQQGFIFDKVALVWELSGTGDYNGDGKTDILWRNTYNGDVALWLMNGTVFQQGFIFNTIPLVWKMAK